MVMGEGTLKIVRPSDLDEGIYQCFAKNDYGTALSSRAVLRKACKYRPRGLGSYCPI